MIALFGGTFDPPHLGHLNMAKHCVAELGLTELRFLPCAIPVHKQRPSVTDEDRLIMLEKLLQNEPKLCIDTRELERHGPSYTLLTLQELRQENPNSGIVFLMGMDSFNSLHKWYQWQEIVQLCHILVYQRPGETLQPDTEVQQYLQQAQMKDKSQLHQQLAGGCYFLSGAQKDVASSDIRAAIKQQNTTALEPWLHRSVIEYIVQQQLYSEQ